MKEEILPVFSQEVGVGIHGRKFHYYGLSLRDMFAAVSIIGKCDADDPKLMSKWAYELADAMLKEREKGKK